MATLIDKSNSYYQDRTIGEDGFVPCLYKFFSIRTGNDLEFNKNLINTINNSYLWHSEPSSFNDPFDCYVELIDFGYPSRDQIKNLVYQGLDGTPRSQKRKEVQRLAKNPQQLSQTLKANNPIFGVCCFTHNQTSNTMWSHYANCHAGVCFEFDHLKLRQSGLVISKVTYETDFKSVKHFEEPQKALLNMLTTKSSEWGYECEYRSMNEVPGKVTFEKSCLTGVTFGCKTRVEDITYLKKIIIDAGYQSVTWRQARMQKKSFDLKIEII